MVQLNREWKPVTPAERWAVAMVSRSASERDIYIEARVVCDSLCVYEARFADGRIRQIDDATIRSMMRTCRYRIVDREGENVMVHRDSPLPDALGPVYFWQQVL